MTDWTEEFNKLPREIRHIAAMVEAQGQINQLKREKARLKKHYQQSVKEINEHIKSVEHWIKSEGAI